MDDMAKETSSEQVERMASKIATNAEQRRILDLIKKTNDIEVIKIDLEERLTENK